jgi:hypothetical protein
MNVANSNSYQKDVVITEATEITGGNFVQANFVNSGVYELTLTSGNFAGCKFDGVSPTEEGDLPEYVTLNGARMNYGFVDVPSERDSQAIAILDSVRENLGKDGIEFWLWTVEDILTNPSHAEAARKQRQSDWARKQGIHAERDGDVVPLHVDDCFTRLKDSHFEGMTFDEVQTEIKKKTLAAWQGLPVPVGV